jgi:hypothetical protein
LTNNDDLLGALEKISREIGGSLIADKDYQINQATLQKTLGENYDELIKGMFFAKLILPGLDELSNEIFDLSFTPYGLECLNQRTRQVHEQTLTTKTRQAEQATADAKLLLGYFHPKRPDETVKVTPEKLGQLLGETSGESLQRRLDLLYTTNYLAANICGEDEYEIVFRTKGVELSREEPKTGRPGPKTHTRQLTQTLPDGTRMVLDTRNLSGAVLATAERAARASLFWVDIFNDPESPPKTKTKMRMNLERADALWGRDLEQQSPSLYLRVMQALGHPEKASLNPILTLDDMEGGS